VKLDLSSNSFVQLPPAIAHIPTLQVLDMSNNKKLQLHEDDPAILCALVNLKVLYLRKKAGKWSGDSVQAIIDITARLPNLVVLVKT